MSHMAYDASFFMKFYRSYFSKVIIGNKESVDVKGKWVVTVGTPSSIKYISDVLFVLDLSQSHLSEGQILKRNYALHFENIKWSLWMWDNVYKNEREKLSFRMEINSWDNFSK